jgi:ATP-dependent helicase HrpB
MAAERGGEVRGEVGYQVRLERRIGPATRLEVLTEGILTRRLLADPYLEGVGAVILDEFHERSIHTDLAIALLNEVRSTVRDDLKLVVMSATLDAEPIRQFLGQAPVIQSEGRAFPVTIEHRVPDRAHQPVAERVAQALRHLAHIGPPGRSLGDVLVFLPGWDEIRRSQRAIESLAREHDWLVLPLHGSLPAAEQDRALKPADRPKIVLATNVAETSLTIDGVTTVIDSGLVRTAAYDPRRGLDRLRLERISRASADQRAGRAGRTAPGRCIRLWPAREDRGLSAFDRPEVHRVDLAPTVLILHAWGTSDVRSFGWFEAPAPAAIEGAERLLRMLGALDQAGRLTPEGRRLVAWPAHPRIGRLMQEAVETGRARDGAAMAAVLSEPDFLSHPDGGPPRAPETPTDSDLLLRLDALNDAERRRFAPALRDQGIDPARARRVAAARDDLLRTARRTAGRNAVDAESHLSPNDHDLLRLALLAFPDRVTLRRGPGSDRGVMVGGAGVRLDRASSVREAELFLAIEAREPNRAGPQPEALVRIASAIEADWLSEFFPEFVRREAGLHYDPERRKVVGTWRWLYHDLVLREAPGAPIDRDEAGRVLAQAIGSNLDAFLRDDQAASRWLDRVAFLSQAMPELGWPERDGPEHLVRLVESACAGCVSLDEVGGIIHVLRSTVSPAQARVIETEAPEFLAVPSGSRIRLSYADGRPRLSVRVQELFGLTQTPRLAGGRVPILLELLGPNYRPVQVTDDLQSFWSNTYAQVRKDLRNRYPRHAWPEDPRTARAEAKGGPRRPD